MKFRNVIKWILVVFFGSFAISQLSLNLLLVQTRENLKVQLNSVVEYVATLSGKGKHCYTYVQNGTAFLLGGSNRTMVLSDVTSCFVTSLSEDIKADFSQMFLRIAENVTAYVKSPSMVWHGDAYVTTFRVRLKPVITKATNETHPCWPYKCTANYLYMQKYDKDFNKLGPGEIVAVPAPIGSWQSRNGPHDARLFVLHDQLYGVMAVNFDLSWVSVLWDFRFHNIRVPAFQRALLQQGKQISEKNWVPLVANNTLYLIRHLDPMHVLKCPNLDNCNFIRNDTDAYSYQMDDEKTPLRGGTSFQLYRHPYYIGIAHTTNLRNRTVRLRGHGNYTHQTRRVYRAHTVVLRVDPRGQEEVRPGEGSVDPREEFRVVYVSDPLKVHPHIHDMYKGRRFWNVVEDRFIFPTGLVVESPDSLLLGVHVSDRASVILKFTGLKNLMDQVIKIDQGQGRGQGYSKGQGTSSGHPSEAFQIQNYLLHRMSILEARVPRTYRSVTPSPELLRRMPRHSRGSQLHPPGNPLTIDTQHGSRPGPSPENTHSFPKTHSHYLVNSEGTHLLPSHPAGARTPDHYQVIRPGAHPSVSNLVIQAPTNHLDSLNPYEAEALNSKTKK